jgi:hypothetical protein
MVLDILFKIRLDRPSESTDRDVFNFVRTDSVDSGVILMLVKRESSSIFAETCGIWPLSVVRTLAKYLLKTLTCLSLSTMIILGLFSSKIDARGL